MDLRFELDDTAASASMAERVMAGPPPPVGPQLAHADWENSTDQALMLYLSEEPAIGDEFSYNGVQWRIIDYRDGWVARLLV